MISTAQLQAIALPLLVQAFAAIGQTLTIVREGTPTGGFDNDGNQTVGADTTTTVRGFLSPLDSKALMRLEQSSGTPVPRFECYLPFSAPVDKAGWHIEYGGKSYYPAEDARNEGMQGIVWVCLMKAPGER